jgi:hypothetical protein
MLRRVSDHHSIIDSNELIEDIEKKKKYLYSLIHIINV